jgi:hypothetical protein
MAADVDATELAVRGQSVAIIGGGMTSAALALAALAAGASQARMCARAGTCLLRCR